MTEFKNTGKPAPIGFALFPKEINSTMNSQEWYSAKAWIQLHK